MSAKSNYKSAIVQACRKYSRRTPGPGRSQRLGPSAPHFYVERDERKQAAAYDSRRGRVSHAIIDKRRHYARQGTVAMPMGTCPECGYSLVAPGAKACPHCGAPNPNPSVTDRIMGPSVWLGIIGGAVFGAVAYGQLGPENVRGAVGAVVGGFIGVLGGTLIGVIAGLSLSGVAWLLGKK